MNRMDIEVQEIGNELPDGRVVVEALPIGGSYAVIHTSLNGSEDTVFAHNTNEDDTCDSVFLGLCFNPNVEEAKRLNVCVRSCIPGSRFSPIVLYDFQKPEKIWEGLYKVETLGKTYYVKLHP